jgi:hypothetical protein
VTILKVDIDRARLPHIERRIGLLCAALGVRCRGVEFYRTAHGWHVRVALDTRMSAPIIVAAQTILGSDWKREAYNLMRARRLPRVDAFWRNRWNVLYDTHTRGL